MSKYLPTVQDYVSNFKFLYVLFCFCGIWQRQALSWIFSFFKKIIFIAFIGAKRHVIPWIYVSLLIFLTPFFSHFHTYFPGCLVCKSSCYVHLFALRWAILHAEGSYKRPNILLQSISLLLSSLPLFCQAQWSVPKCASRRFQPLLIAVRMFYT